MSMRNVYPFTFDFSNLSARELVHAASLEQLYMWDRDDLLALIEAMANKLKEQNDYS